MANICGIDVGGTFTDLVLVDEETSRFEVVKVPSTPKDQSEGFLSALRGTGEAPGTVSSIVHGTTVGLNALLERKGARCVLLTTKGFRDLLELRRRDRPTIYGLTGFFEPLISRERRFEVTERVNFRGQILEEVSEREVKEFLKKISPKEVDVILISFLHSYANPANEERAKALIAAELPGMKVITSSEVLLEFKEFERTSTAALNAFIQPVMARYLGSLRKKLAGNGFLGEILILQCNGGVMSADTASERPVSTTFSGPAGGVMAGLWIAQNAGFQNAICGDMGGTSFDVSLIYEGKPTYIEEKKIYYGLPMRIPSIDITSVGAGGGSIAWIDGAGLLRVGPQSAGADPGPVCYGKGGESPTVTDANLILGRINADCPIGGKAGFRFDVPRAKQLLEEKIAKPLGLTVYQAANAIIEVVNANMASSIRVISIERGYDPRDFVLLPFGGAGPLHSTALARDLGIPKILVPCFPGATSALGCIMADVRHDFVQTINKPVEEILPEEVGAILERQQRQGLALIAQEGIRVEKTFPLFEADMSYEGQIHTIRPTLPGSRLSKEQLNSVFEQVYRKEYGYLLPNYRVMLMNLRTAVIGKRPKLDLKKAAGRRGEQLSDALKGKRDVFFDGKFVECPVYDREKISLRAKLTGPAIIEQKDATIVVEPGIPVHLDEAGNLIMEIPS